MAGMESVDSLSFESDHRPCVASMMPKRSRCLPPFSTAKDEHSMIRQLFPPQPSPAHVNSLQWHHAQSIARQACARVFRDGGQPADALQEFNVKLTETKNLGWGRAVELITESLCQLPLKMAA
jgi:hypothetical protein